MNAAQRMAIEESLRVLDEYLSPKFAPIADAMRGQLEDVFYPEWAGTLAESKDLIQSGELGNFLYLRGPDLFLGDLMPGSHEVALQVFGAVLLNDDPDAALSRLIVGSREAQLSGELLLTSGGAVFESSACGMSGIIHVGAYVRMTLLECRVFQNYARRIYK